jgi:hypothetical protein
VTKLNAEEVKISWSGRKCFYKYILVEMLRRLVTYKELYIHAYSDWWEPQISLVRF